jgi:hypothetical protein
VGEESAAGDWPEGLVGRWRKVLAPDCADRYPATLVFSEGTYRGERGEGQGMIWWDAGIYSLEAGDLSLSVATDELVRYRVERRGDRLEITDPDGCRFAYEPEPAPAAG